MDFTIKTNLGDTKTNLGDTKKGENGKLAFPKCCGGNNGKLPEGQFQSRLLMSKCHFGILPLLQLATSLYIYNLHLQLTEMDIFYSWQYKCHFGTFVILLPLLIPTTATSMDKALFF